MDAHKDPDPKKIQPTTEYYVLFISGYRTDTIKDTGYRIYPHYTLQDTEYRICPLYTLQYTEYRTYVSHY